MHRAIALIDHGSTSTLISLSLLGPLELTHEPAVTSTHGLNRGVMLSAKESRKANHLVQHYAHHTQVDKPEVLVVSTKAYALVLGLQWCKVRNREIDRTKGQLTTMGTPAVPQLVRIPEASRTRALPKRGDKNTNVRLPRTYNHLGLQHSVTSYPAGKCSRHSRYDFENATGCLVHLWKA
jgi:hypothetical protein